MEENGKRSSLSIDEKIEAGGGRSDYPEARTSIAAHSAGQAP